MNHRSLVVVALLHAGLLGCANMPADSNSKDAQQAPALKPPEAAASSAVSSPAVMPEQSVFRRLPPPATTSSTPNLAPYETVIKDFKKADGALNFWLKDDKVLLAIQPEDAYQLFFFSPRVVSGIGEGGIFGGLLRQRDTIGGPNVITLHRMNNVVQVLAVNTMFTAQPGTPAAKAIDNAYSESLLASLPIVSQPDPKTKAVLVDASVMLLGDFAGVGPQLQAVYRQPYALDMRNSQVVNIKGSAQHSRVEVRAHYTTGAALANAPSSRNPSTLPDPRSMFVRVEYTFSRLPDQPMAPRVADARLGHFVTAVQDFSNDYARTPKKKWVNRWRMVPKDPSLTLSPPQQPITFWLDDTIPETYREPIRQGILEWNKAFEKIGFKDAIVVKNIADLTNAEMLDTPYAMVRWMTNAQSLFGAIAPSHVDLRSGEIVYAEISIESLSSRAMRYLKSQVMPSSASDSDTVSGHALENQSSLAHDDHCDYADRLSEQLDYALQTVAATGTDTDIKTASQAFVAAYIKDIAMHEAGHVLGLRHNFRASTVRTEDQLNDPQFTSTYSLSGSVMDYPAVNLNWPDHPAVSPFNVTIGPYDEWAIEYAYKSIPAAQERQKLSEIADRARDPALTFATDEDLWLGIDPYVQAGDLGSDPVAFAKKRYAIALDILKRQEKLARDPQPTKTNDQAGSDLAADAQSAPLDSLDAFTPDDSPQAMRRRVSYALNDVTRAVTVAAKMIGGLQTLRSPHSPSRDLLVPVSISDERAALDVVQSYLRSEGLGLSPKLLRLLAPDYFDRNDALSSGQYSTTDFMPDQVLLSGQAQLMNYLMSDTVVSRLLSNRDKREVPQNSLTPMMLYQSIGQAVWMSNSAPHRNSLMDLQRAHVNLIASLVMRPSSYSRSESRAMIRQYALELLNQLKKTPKQDRQDPVVSAHLADVMLTLQSALDASVIKATP